MYTFVTPKLTGPQLRILERIWVSYHRTGRKYGLATPAPYLLASTAPDQPLLPPPSAAQVVPAPLMPIPLSQPPRNKRARGEDVMADSANKVARPDLMTRSASVRRPVIDLTRQSGHRVVIDLTPLDSDSDDVASAPKPAIRLQNRQTQARKSSDRVRMALMRHIDTIELD